MATRGTTNRNARGSSKDREARRYYLLNTHGNGVTCPCYRCGTTLNAHSITADRIVPGCQGGTYRRDNIRPACSPCNSETGGRIRRKAAVLAAAGALAVALAGCGSGADAKFNEFYKQRSNGAVSVEDAQKFAHQTCDALKNSGSNVLGALIPLGMSATVGQPPAVSDDYGVAFQGAVAHYCPDQAQKIAKMQKQFGGGQGSLIGE